LAAGNFASCQESRRDFGRRDFRFPPGIPAGIPAGSGTPGVQNLAGILPGSCRDLAMIPVPFLQGDSTKAGKKNTFTGGCKNFQQ